MKQWISLVVAVSQNGIIGSNGRLPWRLSADLKKFKAITMGKPIVMGRKTWDSLPRKPLPGRQNIVITRNPDFHAEGGEVAASAEAALAAARGAEEICVIGGGEIYGIFLPVANRIYLTEVAVKVDGDTSFPQLVLETWREVLREHHKASEGDSADFTLRVLERGD
jgi:dihydrofolate reductase